MNQFTSFKINRSKIIDNVLSDLFSLKKTGYVANSYAIDENIIFFKAIKSFSGYIKWLFGRAPKIDGQKLLELTDFSLSNLPKWEIQMHKELISLEKKKFPGLIEPLVDRILNIIISSNKSLIVADFGSGGIEVVRQVIIRLVYNNYKHKVTFVGIDLSDAAHEVALENLQKLKENHIIDVFRIEKLDKQILNRLISTGNEQYKVILCKNDLFKLSDYFSEHFFDVIFHSLFKHHFNVRDKERVELVSERYGKIVLEYDGYKSWPHIIIPHALTGWRDPVFLNATIFSDLRYSTRREIRKATRKGHLRFFKIGTYLLEKNEP